jgi:hypothetical protein
MELFLKPGTEFLLERIKVEQKAILNPTSKPVFCSFKRHLNAFKKIKAEEASFVPF